jgi:integration host factor subunit alpha
MAKIVEDEVGCSHVQAMSLVENVLRHMCAALYAAEGVKIAGFGSVVVKETPPRMARNPKTGEPYPVIHLRRLKFSPSQSLMAELQRQD